MAKYYINDVNGKKLGPLSEEEILALINSDQVTAECKMKKTLMPVWKTAADFEFLIDAIDKQMERRITDKRELEKWHNRKKVVLDGKKSVTASYEQALTPVKAGFVLRFTAFVLDFLVIFVFFTCICLAASGVCALKGLHTTQGPNENANVKSIIKYRSELNKSYQSQLAAWTKKCNEIRENEEYSNSTANTTNQKDGDDDEQKLRLPPEPKKPEDLVVKKPLSERTVKMGYNPTVINDELFGFRLGMLWINTETHETFGCLYAGADHAVWCKTSDLSLLFNIAMTLTAIFAFLFNAVMLQIRTQTIGMWYYGIFLADHQKITDEVHAFRSYLYYLISIFLCWITPFFLIIGLRSPAEIITRIRVIRIAAKN